MSQATRDELLTYLADLVEHLERFAVTVLPPDDRDHVTLGQEPDGSLVIDLATRLPVSRRSEHVGLTIFERWRPMRSGEWELAEYAYELLDHGASHRRAFHRHDVDAFVRAYGRATHEHCEVTPGVVVCGHYAGIPVEDAFDGFERLYGIWLTGERPDCSVLTCLRSGRECLVGGRPHAPAARAGSRPVSGSRTRGRRRPMRTFGSPAAEGQPVGRAPGRIACPRRGSPDG